jgi:CRISPR system Cascade subunit CasB
MTQTKEQNPFIQYLEGLHEDRGALAALRRGLGGPPGGAPEMYRYVVPWLPKKVSREQEAAYYMVASLFAYHPISASEGNLGAHLRKTFFSEGDNASTERRFTALLAARYDDLTVYLRQTISFLKSKNVAVNWQQLFYDLKYWNHPEGFVQKRWAKSFWGRPSKENQENN